MSSSRVAPANSRGGSAYLRGRGGARTRGAAYAPQGDEEDPGASFSSHDWNSPPRVAGPRPGQWKVTTPRGTIASYEAPSTRTVPSQRVRPPPQSFAPLLEAQVDDSPPVPELSDPLQTLKRRISIQDSPASPTADFGSGAIMGANGLLVQPTRRTSAVEPAVQQLQQQPARRASIQQQQQIPVPHVAPRRASVQVGTGALQLRLDSFPEVNASSVDHLLSDWARKHVRPPSSEEKRGCCSIVGLFVTMWVRWKLVVRILPLPMAFVGIRLLLETYTDFTGYFSFTDASFLFASSIFVIGLMLHGVVSDYKESERAPGMIAATLEGIEDSMCALQTIKGLAEHNLEVRIQILQLIDGFLQWLATRDSRVYAETNARLSALMLLIGPVEKTGAAAHGSRLLGEITNVRHWFTRTKVISDTDYLSAGKPMMDVFFIGVSALTVIAKYSSLVLCYTIIGFVTIVYTFLITLINEIDDPFAYTPDGPSLALLAKSSTIDLRPLLSYRFRLLGRIVEGDATADTCSHCNHALHA